MKNRIPRTPSFEMKLVMLSLAAALVTAACSSETDPGTSLTTETATGDTEVVTTEASGATTTTTSTEASGSLTVVVDEVLSEDFDPVLNQASAQRIYYSLIYDALITLDPETGELAPALATDWGVSDDGLTWTLSLRDDVEFSDGTPMTAEDVKFSLERFAASEGTGASRMAEYLDSVNVIDTYTVEVVSQTGAPTFPFDVNGPSGSAGAWIVPKSYVESVGDEAFNSAPVGTGPFTFVSQDPGREMRFEVNESHWGETQSTVKELSLQIVPESTTRMAMLSTGEADIVTGITGPDIPAVQNDQALQVRSAIASALTSIQIGGQDNPDSPLSHLEVRKAISMAIDRQAVVDTLLFGEGEPAYLFGFPTGFGFPSDPSNYVDQYDPGAARTMLEEAGYPDGFELTLFAATIGSDFASAVAQNLEAIGITVDLQVVDIDALLAEFQSPEGKQNTRLVMVLGPQGHGARTEFTQTLAAHLDPESTFTQISGDDYAPLLETMNTETDPVAREQAISDVVVKVFDEETVMAAWLINTIFASGPNVAEWQPIPSVAFPLNLQSVRLVD